VRHAALSHLLLLADVGVCLLLLLLLGRCCCILVLRCGSLVLSTLLLLLLLLPCLLATCHRSFLHLLCCLLLCGGGQGLCGALQLLLVLPEELVLISGRRLSGISISISSISSSGSRLRLLLLLGLLRCLVLHRQVCPPALQCIAQVPEWIELRLVLAALLRCCLVLRLRLLLCAALLLQRRHLALLGCASSTEHRLVRLVRGVRRLLLLLL
jgi:hypothetical protein